MSNPIIPENLRLKNLFPGNYLQFTAYLSNDLYGFPDLEIELNAQSKISELCGRQIPELEYFASHGSGSILCFDTRSTSPEKWFIYWLDSGGGYSGLLAPDFNTLLAWLRINTGAIYEMAKKCSTIEPQANLGEFILNRFNADWLQQKINIVESKFGKLNDYNLFIQEKLKIAMDNNPLETCASMFQQNTNRIDLF
jgi:hypothetical protein